MEDYGRLLITGRMLLRFRERESVFGTLWALVIAVIGNIGLRYLNVLHAPESKARVVWLTGTVALVAISGSAMLIGPSAIAPSPENCVNLACLCQHYAPPGPDGPPESVSMMMPRRL